MNSEFAVGTFERKLVNTALACICVLSPTCPRRSAVGKRVQPAGGSQECTQALRLEPQGMGCSFVDAVRAPLAQTPLSSQGRPRPERPAARSLQWEHSAGNRVQLHQPGAAQVPQRLLQRRLLRAQLPRSVGCRPLRGRRVSLDFAPVLTCAWAPAEEPERVPLHSVPAFPGALFGLTASLLFCPVLRCVSRSAWTHSDRSVL